MCEMDQAHHRFFHLLLRREADHLDQDLEEVMTTMAMMAMMTIRRARLLMFPMVLTVVLEVHIMVLEVQKNQ